MPPPPLRTVHLRWSPALPGASEAAAAVAVEGGGGVDLARVGRALGLDPATVRLNGYFLSRGPGHVSSAVTWRALLAFFASRGLPTGAGAAAPVAVHGRPASSPPRPEPGVPRSSKRKYRLETENCSKKSKLQDNSSILSRSADELLSDDITLGLKRRLRLDETSPSKKIKQVEYSSPMEQKHSSKLNSLAALPTGTESGHGMRIWSPHFHAKEFADGNLSCRLEFQCHKSTKTKLVVSLLETTPRAMVMNWRG